MLSETLAPTAVDIVQVGTVMSQGVINCKPDTPLDEVIRIFADLNVQVLVVTGPNGQAFGAITDVDLLQFEGQDHTRLKAVDAMSNNVVAVPPEMILPEAIQIMLRKRASHLVVTERGDAARPPLGVLTTSRLIKHMRCGPWMEMPTRKWIKYFTPEP